MIKNGMLFSAALMALAGCAHVARDPAASVAAARDASLRSALGSERRRDIVPLVAAHQHLWSKELITPPIPSLPTVSLPADLERLLRRREQVSGAPPTGTLFTEDAIILEMETSRWERGRRNIDRFLGFMFKGVKYVPNDYAASGSAGFIAGTVRIGGSATERMNFLLGLKKDGKGEWQISSEMFTMISPPPYSTVIEADTLIKQLDDAGIKHGVIAALGYLFGSPLPLFGGQPRSAAGEEYPRTRAENDWTIAQASRYPDRLFVLCGVNPLKDYAVEEIQRCSKLQQVKGMKIHFANSGVNMLDPDHVEKVRRFFKAANDFKMPVLAHVRQIGSYNSKHAEAFVNQVLPSAPDIPIQLAHMASGGPPDEATEVYVRAIEAGDPRVKNIYFDITHTVAANGAQSAPALAQIAQIFRRIGIDRIFFGSDLLGPSDPRLTEHWEAVRKLPLTDEELRDLADNVPPYLQ